MDDVTAVLFAATCRANDGDAAYWRRAFAPDALVVGSAPGEEIRGSDALVDAMAGYGAIPCVARTSEGGVIGEAAWCFGHVEVAASTPG